MAKSCGDDMTKPNCLRGSSADCCFLRARQTALIACLSGQRGYAHCAHLCGRAAFRPAFFRCSWFCLHHFMQFSVSGDMTLRPGPSESLDVPGSAGTSPGVPVAGERAVDRVQVCGIRILLPATVLLWLVPSWPVRVWTRGPCTCIAESALQRPISRLAPKMRARYEAIFRTDRRP
jgi:hypothetical protein